MPDTWAPTSSDRRSPNWPSVTRRSATCAGSACSGRSSWSATATTREPLVPYNASGPANAPMAEFAGACKDRGLWPFVHFNRTHVVPPITIGDDEMREGLAIIDEALTVADKHTAAA